MPNCMGPAFGNQPFSPPTPGQHTLPMQGPGSFQNIWGCTLATATSQGGGASIWTCLELSHMSTPLLPLNLLNNLQKRSNSSGYSQTVPGYRNITDTRDSTLLWDVADRRTLSHNIVNLSGSTQQRHHVWAVGVRVGRWLGGRRGMAWKKTQEARNQVEGLPACGLKEAIHSPWALFLPAK